MSAYFKYLDYQGCVVTVTSLINDFKHYKPILFRVNYVLRLGLIK